MNCRELMLCQTSLVHIKQGPKSHVVEDIGLIVGKIQNTLSRVYVPFI